jgi:hypothetical protein
MCQYLQIDGSQTVHTERERDLTTICSKRSHSSVYEDDIDGVVAAVLDCASVMRVVVI